MIDEYRDLGFTFVDRITTDDEMDWLRVVYDHIFASRISGVPGGFFDLARPYDAAGADLLPQAIFPERAIPDLLDTVYVRNARRIAAALLGVDADELEVWGHMIDKPPRTGHETPGTRTRRTGIRLVGSTPSVPGCRSTTATRPTAA
jgi:hypothetical protein